MVRYFILWNDSEVFKSSSDGGCSILVLSDVILCLEKLLSLFVVVAARLQSSVVGFHLLLYLGECGLVGTTAFCQSIASFIEPSFGILNGVFDSRRWR